MAAGDHLIYHRERIAAESAFVMPPPGLEDVGAILIQKPLRSSGHRSRFRRNKCRAMQPLEINGSRDPSAQQFRPPPGLEEVREPVRSGGQVKAQPFQPPGVFECRMQIPKKHSDGIAAYQDYITHLVASSSSALEHQASILTHHADIARRVQIASTGWQSTQDGQNKTQNGYMNTQGGYTRPEHGIPDHSSEAAGYAQEVYSTETASTRSSWSDSGSVSPRMLY